MAGRAAAVLSFALEIGGCAHARDRRRHTGFPSGPCRAVTHAAAKGRIEVDISARCRDGGTRAEAARPHGGTSADLRLHRGGPGMSGIPTIAEAAKQIAAKQLSPVELTRA